VPSLQHLQPQPYPHLVPQIRAAQSPLVPPEQPSPLSVQHILPLLVVIKDHQATILSQNANSDRSLRDLMAEVGKLSQKMEEETKQREAKDKAKEGREKEDLKALTLMAQRVYDVRKRVVGIESVVGIRMMEGPCLTGCRTSRRMLRSGWRGRGTQMQQVNTCPFNYEHS
jgi:hypothetical protein